MSRRQRFGIWWLRWRPIALWYRWQGRNSHGSSWRCRARPQLEALAPLIERCGSVTAGCRAQWRTAEKPPEKGFLLVLKPPRLGEALNSRSALVSTLSGEGLPRTTAPVESRFHLRACGMAGVRLD